MNLQAEIKRVCTLNSYLELIQKCESSIKICEDQISNRSSLHGLDFSNFYTKRLISQKRLLIWLHNRYTLALAN